MRQEPGIIGIPAKNFDPSNAPIPDPVKDEGRWLGPHPGKHETLSQGFFISHGINNTPRQIRRLTIRGAKIIKKRKGKNKRRKKKEKRKKKKEKSGKGNGKW